MDSVPADQRESVQGELGLGTLPALIRKLYEERRTGTLYIRSPSSSCRVHFRSGAVVFASSDRIEDRIGQRLLAQGVVAADAIERARTTQEASGKRFGECLVELHALTEEEVLAEVERQVRSIVTPVFSLDRGQYQFEEADEPVEQDLALDLPMDEIIVDGIRSMDDPIALRIGVGAMTDYLHAGKTSGGADINAAEAFVLSRVDGRTTILDVLSASPLSDVETLRSVCALLAVGIVAAKPEPLETPQPPPVAAEKAAPPSQPRTSEAASPDSSAALSEPDERAVAEERYEEDRRLVSTGKEKGGVVSRLRSMFKKTAQ